jgi:hypothetical protein
MKLMIFPGELDRSFFEDILRGQAAVSISCVVLDSAGQASDWLGYVAPEAIQQWDSLVDPATEAVETTYHTEHYQRALDSLLSDPRTFYILERMYRSIDKDIFFNSVFNRTVQLELVIWNTLSLLHKTRPDRLVHFNVPHGKLWFVARIAELVGVQVYVGAISPLPWKEWIVKGLDAQQPTAVSDTLKESGEKIDAFVRAMRGDYAAAMPSYEKSRYDYFNGGFYSIKKEFRSLGWSLISSRSILTFLIRGMLSWKKKQALNLYQRLSAGFQFPDKFVVFFLHYQPERTSLPEGYQYAQQWLAIRALANSLPDGYRLVVKEHPSTFRYYFNPGFRSLDFYRNIAGLPNTSLVSLDVTPFALIDRTAAVATITGTVGIEAIVRGKPVIVFGAAQYRNVKGVFAVRSKQEAGAALLQIAAGTAVLSGKEMEDYLLGVDRMSFDTDPVLKITSRELMRAAIFAA